MGARTKLGATPWPSMLACKSATSCSCPALPAATISDPNSKGSGLTQCLEAAQ